MTGSTPAQLIRFVFSGALSTAIHAAVALTLIEYAGASPAAANGAAFLVASVFSFLATTLWTFRAPMTTAAGLRFVVTAALSAGLAMAIARAADAAGAHHIAGIALVVAIVPFFTFAMHRLYTYRS